MKEDEDDGKLAVPGVDSHEDPETLTREERGEEDEPLPPPSKPKEASP